MTGRHALTYILNILDGINSTEKVTHLIQKANLDHRTAIYHLEVFEDWGFIEKHLDFFRLTDKGRVLLTILISNQPQKSTKVK